ncbi:helix-turn-helix domain-containing protein [Hoyosella rhizosphaerae]|uniref:AraC family transcriptional regulator n=1 Tax=Hoyosella rhizosphaerae TaxID=1755582 RepID=A0A916UFD6_9ACTN|nr:helix-turn-helix domain-containing protein [Hoyosella rhizosphaerae]MBN4925524.1 helix-turn-helix domain-containing protein [Hoyosella rhizosphaerae]GGC69966.1 AraC family transcriptional regulator [Hoyosella rhizosphaerae]
MLSRVVVVLPPLTETFELGVACEVFGVDRRDDGVPVYELTLVSAVPGPVHTRHGYDIAAAHDLSKLDDADLIIVSAGNMEPAESATEARAVARVLDALRAAVARGVPVASLCTGAFMLGAAGLLDGRRCTTHWRHAAALAEQFPLARVDPSVLYVADFPIYTSAGTAASIDLCLHLVREWDSAGSANAIARRMVVAPHREGGQAQFVNRPLPSATGYSLGDVREWMRQNLRDNVTIADLAKMAGMSTRTFARLFVDETGTTPLRWLNDQRVLAAQHLLESTRVSLEFIAHEVGFSSAASMRTHFLRLRHVTPLEYRRVFGLKELVDNPSSTSVAATAPQH